MNGSKPMRVLFLMVLVTLASASRAQFFEEKQEHYEEEKPWLESQAPLPGAPKFDDLVEIEMGNAAPHRYFVDPASLSTSADGVVRYTMVVETRGGARNIGFEGMRCATGEWKIYAFGRPDGTWSQNKHGRWSPVQGRRADSYRRELFNHYFCTVDGVADMRVIRRALAVGGIRRGGD